MIYSSSFLGAKVAVNIRSGLIAKLQQTNNMVSLRFCFKDPFQGEQVTFFVSARSLGYTPHGDSKDVGLFNIQFTQRPPDDLIEIMGRLLDANVNSTRRKGERVLVTAEILRKLNIRSSECAAFIQEVPRRCILRDISFGGARIIIQGVVKFLLDKEAALRIDFDDPRENFLVKGKFTQAEPVAFRKDMVVLNLTFHEGQIPMGYKVRMNEYFSTVRPGGDTEAKPVPQETPVSPVTPAAGGKEAPVDDKSALPAAKPAEKPTEKPAAKIPEEAAAKTAVDDKA